MATFGKITIGGSTVNLIGASRARGNKYSIGENGTVTTITAYLNYIVGGSTNVKAGLYDDSGGTPNNLIDDTPAGAVGAGAAWHTFTLNVPQAITTGAYHLALEHSVAAGLTTYYDAGAANQENTQANVYPAFPNPFGVPINQQARASSIYATYTPSGAAPSAIKRGYYPHGY